MIIQCDCGKFKAELTNFPKNTPGRLVCYCDDCQNYLKKLNREDVLDLYGGTEVIPVYPGEFKFVQGQEYLMCNFLHEKGLKRWSTTCCNSPIANTLANFPWVGVIHRAYTNSDPDCLENFGPIRSRIKGKYKRSEAPFEISENLSLKDALVVMPFILKGMIFRKYKNSPFFKKDGVTPISEPVILN